MTCVFIIEGQRKMLMKQKSLCFICILLLGNIYISGFALDPLAQASDLSIAFIQREPQNPSWIGQIEIKDGLPLLKSNAPRPRNHWLEPGVAAVFTAHVINQGNIPSPNAVFVWKLDGKSIQENPVASLKANESVKISLNWLWQEGKHSISGELIYKDPAAQDLCFKNNQISIRTNALPFCFFIHKSVDAAFHKSMNLVGSFSAVDWLQAHVARLNTALSESKYPSAPEGCLEQIYADRIFFYQTPQELEGMQIQALADSQGSIVIEPSKDMKDLPKRWNGGIILSICEKLGLADHSKLDVQNANNMVPGPDGLPLYWHYIHSPLIVGSPSGEFRFSEICVLALNKQYGRPRGYCGDYFYDLADFYELILKDRLDEPISNGRVRIYQRNQKNGISRDSVFVGYTNDEGTLLLPNREAPVFETDRGFRLHPNPFGKIELSCENGLFLIEVRANGQSDYFWLSVPDFNLAFWREAAKKHENSDIKTVKIQIKTDIPSGNAPSAPRLFLGQRQSAKKLQFQWQPSLHPKIEKYKLYARKFRSGSNLENFVFIKEITSSATSADGIPFANEDCYYALTAVDESGHDSPFSNWVFVPSSLLCKDMTLSREGFGYINDVGIGRIHRIGENGRLHPFFLHPLPGENLEISNIAWSPQNELAVCNKQKNRVEFYDADGEFLRAIGSSGTPVDEMNEPVDVDFNIKSEMVVVDKGNRRVKLYDLQGRYIERFGEGVLEDPIAVAFAPDGEAHVLDAGRKTCYVFKVTSKNKYYMIRSYGQFRNPTDIVITANGNAYISDPDQRGVVLYTPDGKLYKQIRPQPIGQFEYTDPRGLALDNLGRVLFVDRASSCIRLLEEQP